MISSLVILSTVLMAGGFLLVYVLSPAWRKRIEEPKHCFQEQLQRYDSRTRESHEEIP